MDREAAAGGVKLVDGMMEMTAVGAAVSVTAPLDDTAATLQYENCCSLTQESASWTKNTVRRIAECRLGEE